MRDQISRERRQKNVNHVWDLAQQRNISLKLWSKTDQKMIFRWGEQEWRKKNAKASKSVIKSSCNCRVRHWTNYKTRVSSTDMTVTGWEEGKSICVKLKDVTQAGSSRRKQSHTPPSILYDCAHPRTHGLPPAFKLSPLAPNTRSRAPGSMEVSQAMGFSSAGTGSSLLCLTGLGCSLPPPQPQGPQGREWAVSSMVTPRSRVSTLLLEISRLSK